ncbi:30S ribosomal protein S15 [Candidatus Dependentiae bacterium]|nr:30S ribosomal protein S15 [Candidatus Dependentiae bacterium]
MITKEIKETIAKEFGRSEIDTGSSEVQIALITERIKHIASHLKSFPKDKHSRRGLIRLVARRRAFFGYLKKTSFERYEFVANKLGIKK